MTDEILTVNAGSSSIKFGLYGIADGCVGNRPLAEGQAEAIGSKPHIIVRHGNEVNSDLDEFLAANADHAAALARIMERVEKDAGASKAGIVLPSRSAALNCAEEKYNIRVNTVHPGFIETKMVGGFLQHTATDINGDGDVDRARRELEARHPLGHPGEPDDVAYAVLYLASDESKFATGSELVINGGYTAR